MQYLKIYFKIKEICDFISFFYWGAFIFLLFTVVWYNAHVCKRIFVKQKFKKQKNAAIKKYNKT